MSQKFPHINITPVGASSASPGSSKPLLTVKLNSQLSGVSGVKKSKANIVAAGKVNVGNSKAITAAKNKLALFKAQVNQGFE